MCFKKKIQMFVNFMSLKEYILVIEVIWHIFVKCDNSVHKILKKNFVMNWNYFYYSYALYCYISYLIDIYCFLCWHLAFNVHNM